jgi:short-subunit dehydrogenase
MLAESRCRLVLTARTRQQLEEVKQEILGHGGEAIAVPTDLTRDEDIAVVVNDCKKAWGTVDFLVNNAGWGKRA